MIVCLIATPRALYRLRVRREFDRKEQPIHLVELRPMTLSEPRCITNRRGGRPYKKAAFAILFLMFVLVIVVWSIEVYSFD